MSCKQFCNIVSLAKIASRTMYRQAYEYHILLEKSYVLGLKVQDHLLIGSVGRKLPIIREGLYMFVSHFFS